MGISENRGRITRPAVAYNGRPGRMLPPWPAALAVIAHPDDESFGLGAVISQLAAAGTRVHVLCYSRGEASTLNETGAGAAVLHEMERAAGTQHPVYLAEGAPDEDPRGGMAGITESEPADGEFAPAARTQVVVLSAGAGSWRCSHSPWSSSCTSWRSRDRRFRCPYPQPRPHQALCPP